jgi:predicted nucleotidyltransferase
MRGTADEYVRQVLRRYAVSRAKYRAALNTARGIAPVIQSWAGTALRNISVSGSHAKGTAVAGGSDLDIFISLRSGTANTLGDIYWSLYQLSLNHGWSPRPQTVSIGLNLDGVKIDLVPARLYPKVRNWHSLYNSKTESWMQTNVAEQVRTVARSGRVDEIRALKIWRNLRSLNFHSFYLELTVINALRNLSTRLLSENVKTALEYVAYELPRRRVVDPANSNNIISNDLEAEGKEILSAAAHESLQYTYWEEVIW